MVGWVAGISWHGPLLTATCCTSTGFSWEPWFAQHVCGEKALSVADACWLSVAQQNPYQKAKQ